MFLGLGLGGIEKGFPPELFTDTFAKAKDYGMRVVAHAGEAAGPESIKGALLSLNAERIGHGIQCIKDPEVINILKDRQTPIEVCPNSNYRTGVISKDENHPLKEMMNLGLYCTLNSDDPPMFATSLTDEYLTLAKKGFSWEELWRLNLNTLDATFLSDREKSNLQKKWTDFSGSF